MTQFFDYDALTWAKVAALPRDTPLVVPLGTGYLLDRLVSALGESARVGMLPPILYGWQGSGLSVTDHLLGTMLANLRDSLRDDGFSRVSALTPSGIELGFIQEYVPQATKVACVQVAEGFSPAAAIGERILV